jgi:hypothetical protein
MQTDQTMNRFDPFNDRTSRDIRNTLSEVFVAAWNGGAGDLVSAAADLRAKHPARRYRHYIDARMAAYQDALTARRAEASTLMDEMIVIWNRGLFFEVHELLEGHWHQARGEQRETLKILIQAAGVFVHREAGRTTAAAKMGKRVSARLETLRPHLAAIANLDALRTALQTPGGRAPQLKGRPS